MECINTYTRMHKCVAYHVPDCAKLLIWLIYLFLNLTISLSSFLFVIQFIAEETDF